MRELIKLWEHQREAAEKAAAVDSFAFFMDLGTGKTATAITALRRKCYAKGRLLRTIIFCPPVVRRSWQREFAAHSTIKPHLIHVLEGTGKVRLKTFREKAFTDSFGPLLDDPQPGVFITNYESLLMADLFKLMKAWRPEVLIFDESHLLKSYSSQRTKLAIELSDVAECKYLLTGTPILNKPMDIWSQYRIMDGGATFDRNFFAFRARWFRDRNAGMPKQRYFPDWQPIEGLEKSFNELIYKKAVRVMKSECLDLPPFVRQQVDVELTAEQAKMYESMKKHFIAYLDDKACVAKLAITKGLRLLQMVSGFFVDDEGNEHTFDKNPRIAVLKELLEELHVGHKVIVWAIFRNSYAAIAGVCNALGIPYRSLHGGMTPKSVQESIDSFQTDPSVRVMIANQAAGGTGVTLTAASYAIYFSRNFDLALDTQSEARCYRGGSQIHAKVTRIDLVAPGTIDEVVLEALRRKEDMAEAILKIRGKL